MKTWFIVRGKKSHIEQSSIMSIDSATNSAYLSAMVYKP